jgi:flagellar basal body rod protein FlgC
MSLFGGLEISASGLTAERLRMDVSAENLANAQTTRGTDGQPYRRKEVILQETPGSFGASLSAAMGSGDDSRTALEGLSFSPTKDASAGATRADGSTVDVDAESAKLAANALEQQAATQVLHARLGILKAAMGVSS